MSWQMCGGGGERSRGLTEHTRPARALTSASWVAQAHGAAGDGGLSTASPPPRPGAPGGEEELRGACAGTSGWRGDAMGARGIQRARARWEGGRGGEGGGGEVGAGSGDGDGRRWERGADEGYAPQPEGAAWG
ncbi:hypothetical protein I4F81_004952 [Pyropia yezoensis]|uniref:Uncharacterized protein n=1 Tax=Pyropia yezoensis TaxID=2788 RepID=A0ACC3BXN7_PYRYE|nr:hypothetical protein I4F81_004952 [Neopyropia yezoensis]